VALQDDGSTLLGKSVDRQQYLRQRRWIKIALAIITLLLAVIVMFLEM
jgi:hypothetical protein